MALALCLQYVLSKHAGLKATFAADVASDFVGYSERTVREWKRRFHAAGGTFPDSQQGHYTQGGVLWQDEDLNQKARDYIRFEGKIKGKPNLTVRLFCSWVNTNLHWKS